jgi:asparagine synthetase B (glutamine-hydrolysing)
MFYFSFTQELLKQFSHTPGIKQTRMGGQFLTIMTDGLLSGVTTEADGLRVMESLSPSEEGTEGLIMSEVRLRTLERTIDIRRDSGSGRPIYYYLGPRGEFYCSTHVGILRKAGVPIEENQAVLPEFFVYRYVMPPETLYKNIRQIQAGGCLKVKIQDGKCILKRLEHGEWFNPAGWNVGEGAGDVSHDILISLSESCRRMERGSAAVTLLFSGGLDSSILLKVCQPLFDIKETHSTSYPFEIPENNAEREYALSAAREFGIAHRHHETTTTDYLLGFLQAIEAAEEPLHHLQSVLLFLLLKNIPSKETEVVLSGLGADGIFGSGYHERIFPHAGLHDSGLGRLLSSDPFSYLLKKVVYITGRGKYRMRYLLPLADPDHILWLMGKYGDDEWVCSHFGIRRDDIVSNRCRALGSLEDRSLLEAASVLSFLGSASVTQAIWSKLGEVNRKILVYPFTGANVIRSAFSIPWEVKLSEPKGILRRAARHLNVPEFIVSRPKKGWGIKEERWGERDGVLEPLVPLAAKIFDEKEIRLMQSSVPRKAMTFWNMLNYAIWKRLCIHNESVSHLSEELREAMSCMSDRAPAIAFQPFKTDEGDGHEYS